MIQKLRKQNGETLIESMMSLLVALMCMGILVTSVTTATKLNRETNKLDEKYAMDLQVAEQHMSLTGYEENTNAKVTIDFAEYDDSKDVKNLSVTVYGGNKDANAFASYKR